MIYVNLEFISMYYIIFLTIQANGRSQMDQVGKKTKKDRKKEKQFANNLITVLINNQKWISSRYRNLATFIVIQIEYRRPVFPC